MLTTLLLLAAQEGLHALPPEPGPAPQPVARDWLVDRGPWRAGIWRSDGGQEVVLSNGLVRRAWRVEPNAACVAIDDLRTGESILRAVKPMARVTIDGAAYPVGGLIEQPNGAYLDPSWLDGMPTAANALRLEGWQATLTKERVRWPEEARFDQTAVWPPAGRGLRFDFRPPASVTDAPRVLVSVHVELYDGLPVFMKWISVTNEGDTPITLDRFTSEELAVVEAASWVETREGVPLPVPQQLHVETDFAFGGFTPQNANRHVVHWRADPEYTSIVNYTRQMPSLLVVEPSVGPAQVIEPGATFESQHTFEAVHDSTDRERRGLTVRRMIRALAPWCLENPLMHHMRVSDPDQVRRAIDDAAEVGFEVVLMSFGSGFDMEDDDPRVLDRWRDLARHARERGVELGGYSLLSSRHVGAQHQIVSPDGARPTHGQCPALTSAFGLAYLRTVRDFFAHTGFEVFEHDGPYPGDIDTVARPPLQRGELDSRWAQWRLSAGLYSWCLEHGVYVNAPDRYVFNGSTKCGMGYREVNWSLPRAQQVIHTRQNIYDGTWLAPPSLGWMFVPLTEYHGGGPAATVEPLDQHRDHYQRMLASNLGLGVQACYRGPRLFDTDRTRELVASWVRWYKQHREVLEGDLVHGRRADGRDLDWMLHVNPHGDERGMLCVYNPLETARTRTLRVDLHYTGIRDRALVQVMDGEPREVPLQGGVLELPVTVAAGGMTWVVLR